MVGNGTIKPCIIERMGVNVNSHDIDIAHRLPKRNALAGLRPIVCKFVRRLVINQVIAARREASKVQPDEIGLPANSDPNMSPNHF